MSISTLTPDQPSSDRLTEPVTEPANSVLEPDVDPTAIAEPVAPGAPKPDLEKTGEVITTPRSGSLEVTVLVVLALLYSLYFAREFLVPIVFALLLNFLLSPAIRGLTRVGLRPPAGAALVVLALLAAIGGGIYGLAGPAQRWAAAAPETLSRVETKVRGLVRPVQQMQRTAEHIERAAGSVSSSSTSAAKPQEVVVRSGPGL
ncbi:MAG TPA: AI-2E family transporter, partial [Gemmatimonadaceae bacterium]|nr:AI-2E family transporter [Gemmatimonadaceae bacterium]